LLAPPGRVCQWTVALSLALSTLPAASQSAVENKKLLDQYCAGCHNSKLKTANLSVEGLDLGSVGRDAEIWEKVLRKVSTNQMPHSALPQPSDPSRKALVAYLESELDRYAALHPNPGRATIHRLNRTEYSNVIRDLLALDVKPGATLPPDDTGYGFDNIGDVLSLSPVRVERYLSVARRVARLGVGDPEIKPAVDAFDALFDGSLIRASRNAPRTARNERVSEDLPFDSMGGLSLQYLFPLDAEYVFKIKMSVPSGFTETAPPVGQIFEMRLPVKAGPHHVGLTFMRSDALPEILPSVGRNFGGGRSGSTPPPTAFLDFRLDGARLKLYEVPETVRGREINELSIAGPYNPSGPGETASRRRLFVCRPSSAGEEQACAEKILSALVRRAYRRPPVDADIRPLMSFYRSARHEGSFDSGIEAALTAALVSPNFLFRIERDPAGKSPGSVYRLNDFELASRLSFFLWSSMADDELLEAAQKGELQKPDGLRRQVARMLDDAKSQAFVSNFSGQWLLLRNLEQVTPDPVAFPDFDDSLRSGFQRESELFFNAILRENRPVTDLLDANFTFLNQRLAEFYKIPGVYGPRFRRVELTDGKRGGLLGQGSILTVTSYPTRTSVVQRGKWILENLLGSPPPAPPANVPPLELHKSERKLTVREAMEQHRANPTCAACHARMDPIGFALENYDGVGAWRDRENDAAIDASGKLPDGSAFQGPDGLKRVLLDHNRQELLQTFLEKLMTYALGRGVESYDRPAMRAILRNTSRVNPTIPALIDAIVESPQFQMRRVSE
jgi:mono/diheme cytochrome c family protein